MLCKFNSIKELTVNQLTGRSTYHELW